MAKASNYLKKFWHFMWEEDSLWSWIVSVIVFVILIKYLIFPGFGMILGSKYPFVAVVSDSMEHKAAFDDWWNSPAKCKDSMCTQADFYKQAGITKEQFRTFILKNGFNTGDVMILTSTNNIKLGDIIVFYSKDGRPIIHRVIDLNPLQTKGDKNQAQITPAINPYIDETNVPSETLVGKVALRIPVLGYVKILFANILSIFGLKVA